MDEIIQKRSVATDDLRLFAYLQHMAQTARSAPAKRAYELFLQQEKQRNDARCQESGSMEATTAPY